MFQQAIRKLVHSEEAKLEKATFTGCCYSLGNSSAATYKVKTHYQKVLNAWTLYFEATLCAAWDSFVRDYPGVTDTLKNLIDKKNKADFLTELRYDLYHKL